jgi:DNA-binding PadR family transcriptional regulator
MKVLRAFLDQPGKPQSGADIWRATGVMSGSLYPILNRLETAGWLNSQWEDIDPKLVCRPAKRLYQLTAEGASSAHAALQQVMPAGGRLQWNY